MTITYHLNYCLVIYVHKYNIYVYGYIIYFIIITKIKLLLRINSFTGTHIYIYLLFT